MKVKLLMLIKRIYSPVLINYPALFDDHPAFAIALCETVDLSLAFDGALTLRAGCKLPRERRVDA